MMADTFDDGCSFAGVVDFGKGCIMSYQGMDIPDVNEAIAMGARHFWVHLGDDVTGGVHGGAGDIDAGTEGAIAMFVGWGDLDEGNVDGQQVSLEELGDLAEEDGYIVPVEAVNDIPRRFADEEGVHEEALAPLGVIEVEVAHGGNADEFDVMEVIVPGLQGLYEVDGSSGAAMDEDPVAAFYFLDRLIR
jgi:hypothetical protein